MRHGSEIVSIIVWDSLGTEFALPVLRGKKNTAIARPEVTIKFRYF